MVLLGCVPDPEDEAVLELTNLDSMSIKLAIWYLDELKRLSNLDYCDEIKIAELKENFNGMSIEIRNKEKFLQQEQWAYLSTHPLKHLTSFCYDDDDDEDYTSTITPNEPVLSTEEPDNSLSMGAEHLDTIPAMESDEFIKSGVENLIPIPSESEEFSLIDDDSFSIDDIDYVEASPPDSELVSSEVMEIVIPEVGGIDDDILLTIKDDILHEKLLNVNLLIANIEALNTKHLVSPLPLDAKPKKRKSYTVTLTLPKSQGPAIPGALSKKRKMPKSKNPPTETKVTPPMPTKGSEQSHSIPSGTVHDP
nr:hypothetical protein [Tanacetum cinerariifolium]